MTKIKHARMNFKYRRKRVTIQNDLGGGLFCATISGYHQIVVDDDQIGGIKEYQIINRKELLIHVTLVMDKVQTIKCDKYNLIKDKII